jgi:CRISPR/Cas system-associated endonuclease Cas1
MPYEKIVLSGNGYISTEALSLLNQNNRNLILVDTYGKPVLFLNGSWIENSSGNYGGKDRDSEFDRVLSEKVITRY